MYKVEKTEVEGLYKVTEQVTVKTTDNQEVTIDGNSWLFTPNVLEQEIEGLNSEITKRQDILTQINGL